MIHTDVMTAAKAGEPERYLAALLAPAGVQADLMALAAFAADLRRIPQIATESMIGEIRLQWWRDAIAGFATDQRTGHPIADALVAAAQRHALSEPILIAMTEARAFDLYDDPPPDEPACAAYLNKTEGLLFGLGYRVCTGRDAPFELTDVAARSFGHARLLADLPIWLSRGQLPFALATLATAGVDPATLVRGETSATTTDFIAQQARDIEAAGQALRQMARTLTRLERLAFLPVATVPAYLRVLTAKTHNPVRMIAEINPAGRALKIASAYALGL